jgi:hypothetical protein
MEDDMKSVYVVYCDEYTVGVFSSNPKARAYIDKVVEPDEREYHTIREFELDRLYPE